MFLVMGCQTRGPIQEAVTEPAPPPPQDLLQGDEYFRKGEYDRALEAYAAALEREPAGPEAPRALFGMGEIRLKSGHYEEALFLFERILREYPTYDHLDRVETRIMECQYRTGSYEKVVDGARKWLEARPDHPLRSEVFAFLGMGYEALGDDGRALRAYLEAAGAAEGVPEDLNLRVMALIGKTPPEILEPLVDLADGTAFAPPIHHRLALAYLMKGLYEEAMHAAMALVRSTPEDSWVTKGRDLLERIESERAVRQGVIGCLLPLSGSFAIYGQEVLNGIELGLSIPMDSKGDPAGLELVIRDTLGEEEKAVSDLEELVEREGVLGIIGPLSSAVTAAVARRAQALGVPVITLSQKEGITLEGDMVFRNFLTPSKEVKALLERVVDDYDLRRFAVLYPDNAYGRFFLELFKTEVEQRNGAVIAAETYREDETDFAEQIKKLVDLYHPRRQSVEASLSAMRTLEQEENEVTPEEPQPLIDFDAVFIPDSFHRVIMIAPQLLYHDVKGVFLLGTSLWQSPELVKMGGEYLQGAIFPAAFFLDSEDPEVVSFVEVYRTEFGSDPSVLAATGYDTVRLLASVLSGRDVRSRRNLQRALMEVQPFPGLTGVIYFDESGEVMKDPFLLTVSGDRLTVLPSSY